MIVYNVENEIATLVVNRPQVRNALNWQTMQEFNEALQNAQNQNLRALIITGAGKAFISGGDVADLHQYTDEAQVTAMTQLMVKALNTLENLPCLTLAAMEGPTRGGGCEVALACDWRIAAEDADFGLIQIRLGLTTGWGGAARLQKLVGYARALDLLALGRVLTAAEAQKLGVITHLAPPNEALKTAHYLANSLATFDKQALYAYKKILRDPGTESAEFTQLWFSEAHTQAVKKFMEKRS